MRRHALRDDQWDRIKDFLPGREGHVGGTAADNRLFVEAVLFRYRAGIPWRGRGSAGGASGCAIRRSRDRNRHRGRVVGGGRVWSANLNVRRSLNWLEPQMQNRRRLSQNLGPARHGRGRGQPAGRAAGGSKSRATVLRDQRHFPGRHQSQPSRFGSQVAIAGNTMMTASNTRLIAT